MYTSYFANLKNIKKNLDPWLAICGKSPNWYTGPEYTVLAPKWSFFKEYKDGTLDASGYTREYQRLVLDPLDAKETYDYICKTYGSNVVLLCYEKPGDFCHRRLVAEWFEKELNIQIPEYGV